MTRYTATYSPDDNKLRLYATSRLDPDTYARVTEAGYKWAPKQGLFVAPMWTPTREDVALELAGAIEDDDRSLVDRAEERAERFDGYSDKRASEAHATRDRAAALADAIPFGQPILVGHHSEARARKDAERIRSGFTQALKLWETSEYWERRAAGALRHAKYKELPAVRARRIKGLEADLRKAQRERDEAEKYLKAFTMPGLTHEQAVMVAATNPGLYMPRKEGDDPTWNYPQSAYGALTDTSSRLYAPRTLDEVVQAARDAYPRRIAHYDRWIAHYQNRLVYERAMLAEAGGMSSARHDIVAGGRVLVGNAWYTVASVTKRNGEVTSLRVAGKAYGSKIDPATVLGYEPPTAEAAAAAKEAGKLPPLVNYPGEGFTHMTQAEYKAKHADYKGTRTWGAGQRVYGNVAPLQDKAPHRQRMAMVSGCRLVPVYLTDAKEVWPEPATGTTAPALPEPEVVGPARPLVAPAPKREAFTVPEVVAVVKADFLTCSRALLGEFDRVVMNPPFANAADIAHIRYAVTMLKPGGRLVAICADGPRQQVAMAQLGAQYEPLPEGSFASVGTNVRTALVVYEAPL